MTVPTGEVRRVSDEILARIVAGEYPSGLRLPAETDLAAEFACGRSTVREALRHLAGLGVVRSRRGSGAMVLDFRREGTLALLPSYLLAGRFDVPTPTLARELLHLRAMLAAEAVRLAARYAEPESLVVAKRILAESTALEDDAVAHAASELELYRALVVASRIWPAVWMANAFWAPMRGIYDALAPVIGHVPEGYRQQMETLLALIERRDEAGADAHLRAWLERVDTALLEQVARLLGGVRLNGARRRKPDGDRGLERTRRGSNGQKEVGS